MGGRGRPSARRRFLRAMKCAPIREKRSRMLFGTRRNRAAAVVVRRWSRRGATAFSPRARSSADDERQSARSRLADRACCCSRRGQRVCLRSTGWPQGTTGAACAPPQLRELSHTFCSLECRGASSGLLFPVAMNLRGSGRCTTLYATFCRAIQITSFNFK